MGAAGAAKHAELKEIDLESKNKLKVLDNLYLFYKSVITSRYTNDVHAKHIFKLSRELERLTRNKTKTKRICVSMPPQHSKSSLITLAYPLWLIIQNPNNRILIVNAEKTLSETFGVYLREIAKEILPEYGLRLSTAKRSSTHLMFEDLQTGKLLNGSIRLTGVAGSITGHPVDYLIIDDPYKGIEDITPTYLDKRKLWFDMMIEQRLRPESKLIVLHTRWHSQDIIGYLLEKDDDDYKFITYPAILADGSGLWKEARTIEWYEKKRERMGDRLFSAIFQQQPLDLTSKFFYMQNWNWMDSFDGKYEDIVRAWDIAYDEEDSDNQNAYSVGVLMARVNTRSYWILDYVRGRFGEKTIDKVRETARMDGRGVPIIIETGTDGGAAETLFKMWKKQLSGYYVKQAKTHNKSKPDRAYPLSGAVFDGYLHGYLPDINERIYLEKEFNSFPNGEFKDLVDASAHAFNHLSTLNSEELYGVS